MSLKTNGSEVRRAINFSTKHNSVYYEQVDDDIWFAEVSYEWKLPISYGEGETFWEGTQRRSIDFEVRFIPNQVTYSRRHMTDVYHYGSRYPIDWKTYRWAVRKLSQHQIIQKMVDS